MPQLKLQGRVMLDIVAASEQQYTGIKQVNSGVDQLNQTAQENASSSQELASTSELIKKYLDDLKPIIGFFDMNDIE